jgi:shikimate kinase
MLPGERRNLVLIGMPGVGKSTVGVLLAKRLGYSFLDTDIFIQAREGKSLQELIRQHGTGGFCDIEETYVRSITIASHVIATGGSVVYRPDAMKHLGASGVVIHLDLSLPKLKRRLDDVNARGVVIGPGQTLKSLFAERHSLYLKYADITVETDGLSADRVVEKITHQLAKTSDFERIVKLTDEADRQRSHFKKEPLFGKAKKWR